MTWSRQEPVCAHGIVWSKPCLPCNRITNHLTYHITGWPQRVEGLDIRSATDLVGQCPGCFSLHSVPPEMDWECDCGEAVTIIDLRAKPRHPKWTDMPTGGPW
jgi:hypothetical protein